VCLWEALAINFTGDKDAAKPNICHPSACAMRQAVKGSNLCNAQILFSFLTLTSHNTLRNKKSGTVTDTAVGLTFFFKELS
jgi:hypothetical protein